MKRIYLLLACLLFNTLALFAQNTTESRTAVIRTAGFVCLDKVYNSELTAPYDILQHTIYRDSLNYIECFVVTPDGKPFVTSEGLTITPHYSFANVPDIDILVIPSTENSMDADLKNKRYMEWIRYAAEKAEYVMTLCDGAFPLAATGLLNGRLATTFPSDRERLQKMFPEVKVKTNVNFVSHGKYITSVGGALSFEPALYLAQKLYGYKNAHRLGVGLVLDWQLSEIPHIVIEE